VKQQTCNFELACSEQALTRATWVEESLVGFLDLSTI